jgi:hypothetical protein
MNTSIKSIPSFNNAAAVIIKALSAADNAAAKYSVALATTMQQYLDGCAIVGMLRDNAAVKSIGNEIRTCQAMLDAVAIGMLEKKTVTEYAQSAMRAYFHDVAFSQGLKNDPDYQIPNANGAVKVKVPSKGGKIQSTDRAALDKTIQKMLVQARLLGLTEFAANVLDVCIDSLDDFNETQDAPL